MLVICRMEKLTTEQQVALKHAAIIGEEFSLELLISIIPAKLVPHVDTIISALLNSSFIEASLNHAEGFMFSNDTIRQIICDLTPPG